MDRLMVIINNFNLVQYLDSRVDIQVRTTLAYSISSKWFKADLFIEGWFVDIVECLVRHKLVEIKFINP